MARYAVYVDEITVKFNNDLITFTFDNGAELMLDRGELAEVLLEYMLDYDHAEEK